MSNFLDFEIGDKKRIVTVKNIKKIDIDMPDGTERKKVCFTVVDHGEKIFQISDTWVIDSKDNRKIQGLWYTLSSSGRISPTSSLAKLMNYYGVTSLRSFIDKEVEVYPDVNDYLVLTSCDMGKTKEE